MKRIVAVAGDPGGAAALLPVVRALASAPNIELRALAYRQAVEVWSELAKLQHLPDSASLDIDSAIGADAIDLVLTATSVNGVDHEPRFWRWAERHAVPSIALLDFWTNYGARFGAGVAPILPSRVAVMDGTAAAALADCGVPPNRIVVTGQPAFDRLVDFRLEWSTTRAKGWRQRVGIPRDARLVLFVSQPLSSEMAKLGANTSGADELGVLRAVASALDDLASEGHNIALAVRPHPRQTCAPGLPETVSVPVRRDSQGSGWEAVCAADVVVGINTVLLVEACLLGCLVISVQPGGSLATDPLPTNRTGRSVPVYDLSKLGDTLREALLGTSLNANSLERPSGVGHVGATSRVLELIEQILAARTA